MKIKDCKFILDSQIMILTILDQSGIVKYKLGFRFEWWGTFGPLYFWLIWNSISAFPFSFFSCNQTLSYFATAFLQKFKTYKCFWFKKLVWTIVKIWQEIVKFWKFEFLFSCLNKIVLVLTEKRVQLAKTFLRGCLIFLISMSFKRNGQANSNVHSLLTDLHNNRSNIFLNS